MKWWLGELEFMERDDADPKARAVAKHMRKRIAEHDAALASQTQASSDASVRSTNGKEE